MKKVAHEPHTCANGPNFGCWQVLNTYEPQQKFQSHATTHVCARPRQNPREWGWREGGWAKSPISDDDGFDVVTPEIRTLRNFRRQIRKLEVIPDPYVLFWVSRLFLGAFLKKTAMSIFFLSVVAI